MAPKHPPGALRNMRDLGLLLWLVTRRPPERRSNEPRRSCRGGAMMDQVQRATDYWSQPPPLPPRTRWWQSRLIVRHINRRICGFEVDGTEGGDIELIKQ